MGLNILVGYSGQISLGHGAFMAIGAYIVGHPRPPLQDGLPRDDPHRRASRPGLLGFLFGVPALRLSALYLALATFALAVVTPSLIKRPAELTGGVQGIVLPSPGTPRRSPAQRSPL